MTTLLLGGALMGGAIMGLGVAGMRGRKDEPPRWPRTPVAVATLLVALMTVGPAARADLVINVIATPASQKVLEGGGGVVQFFIFNNSSTNVAYVDAGSFDITCPPAFGSADIDDFIICDPYTVSTGAPKLKNTNIYKLGTFFSGTNGIEIDQTFTTPSADVGPDVGTNLVILSFSAAQDINAGALVDPMKFTAQSTVIVADLVPAPASLVLLALGGLIWPLTRARRRR